MIWESWYWRSDLLKRAASLRRRMGQKRCRDASLARCEQTVLIGLFEVRKLVDSRKLTRDFAAQQVKVNSYRSSGSRVHWLNRRNLDQLYDFACRDARTVTVEYLCNQMIHSYVFALYFNEVDRLDSVLVASERTRNKELLEVSVTTIVEIFDQAGKGEQTFSARFDEKTGDYVLRR